MRVFAFAIGLLFSTAAAWAQPAPSEQRESRGPLRFESAGVTRSERVVFDDDLKGRVTATGGAVGVLFSKHYGIEGEFTHAVGQLNRSYEGNFTSYAEPGATREEIERMAVRARRSMKKTPGIGGSVAFTARANAGRRADVVLRVGAMFRQYVETETTTVLSVPEGIEFERAASAFRDSRRTRTRGGLLFGLDIPIHISRHLTLGPDVRFVWGGPAQFDSRYSDASVGARATWRF